MLLVSYWLSDYLTGPIVIHYPAVSIFILNLSNNNVIILTLYFLWKYHHLILIWLLLLPFTHGSSFRVKGFGYSGINGKHTYCKTCLRFSCSFYNDSVIPILCYIFQIQFVSKTMLIWSIYFVSKYIMSLRQEK